MIHAGFWWRVLASIIDSFILVVPALLIGVMLAIFFTGASENLIEAATRLLFYILMIIYTFYFWLTKAATPGKLAVKVRIVDAKTGGKPSAGQFIGRYFAYILSTLPLGLGFLWVAFDRRKQGWHDKLAGTLVIRVPSGTKVPSHPEGIGMSRAEA